ncbi:MAG: hypothetical protein K0S88_4024, partial [Actinomycetia bacterium]|nr:hypothetical protein [Actinomycetes bacterium]
AVLEDLRDTEAVLAAILG